MTKSFLQSWIDGSSVYGTEGGDVMRVISPWSGEIVYELRPGGAQAVDAAVASAKKAFQANRGMSTGERIAWLDAAASEIENCFERIVAAAISALGKPRRAARFEVQRSIQFIRACAAYLPNMGGDVLPLDAAAQGKGLFGFTKRVPYGVVGAVTPFNAPSNLLLQKVAPALAVGNAIVVKPAPEGTEIAFLLAECFGKAGLPKGLYNVVAGGIPEAQALAAHRDVTFVTITGGTAAGRALAAAAGAKPFVGELGGNAANIICADADIEDAVKRIVPSAFEASGQQCISAQRIIVERSVLDQFMALFVAQTRRLIVGDPDHAETDVGPVVHTRAADRIMSILDEAETRGAEIVLKPTRKNCLISPAIVLSSDDALRIVREEIFGPAVVVIPADSVSDAIRIANASEFGLQTSCFTRSLDTAFRVSEEIESGSVWINEGSRFRLDNYPFGGVGSSGHGREGIRFAMEGFTQWKFTGFRFPAASWR